MKYVELILYRYWSLEEHFDYLVPRMERVAALGRLLSNLGRFGAPPVHGTDAVHGRGPRMGPGRRDNRFLRRLQMPMAIAIIFTMVDLALASLGSFELLTAVHAHVYRRTSIPGTRGGLELGASGLTTCSSQMP